MHSSVHSPPAHHRLGSGRSQERGTRPGSPPGGRDPSTCTWASTCCPQGVAHRKQEESWDLDPATLIWASQVSTAVPNARLTSLLAIQCLVTGLWGLGSTLPPCAGAVASALPLGSLGSRSSLAQAVGEHEEGRSSGTRKSSGPGSPVPLSARAGGCRTRLETQQREEGEEVGRAGGEDGPRPAPEPRGALDLASLRPGDIHSLPVTGAEKSQGSLHLRVCGRPVSAPALMSSGPSPTPGGRVSSCVHTWLQAAWLWGS